jgi:hypothetical protein
LPCLTLSIASAGAGERPILVELFTSEGCSSCPPADALLAELAKRPGVLALSFHVDYWDRLGWKDPFSEAAATARQNRYAALLGRSEIYTPQIVVDGRWQAVGSDRSAVERALAAAEHDPSAIPVALAVDRGQVQVKLGPAADPISAAVLLIAFDRRHVGVVGAGENGGRILTHVDVVRGFAEIGRFDGRASAIAAPLRWPADRVAAIVQAGDGHILGIAVADATPL